MNAHPLGQFRKRQPLNLQPNLQPLGAGHAGKDTRKGQRAVHLGDWIEKIGGHQLGTMIVRSSARSWDGLEQSLILATSAWRCPMMLALVADHASLLACTAMANAA